MSFESSIAVTNSTATEIVLHLEPWGDQFVMPAATTLSLRATAEQTGSFEIEHLENEIIVWAWPSASVKVFNDEVEAGVVVNERPKVPAIPEGQRVSSFLRSILGQERTRKS